MSYIGQFLGRLPGAPPPIEPPQGRVQQQTRLPRPPGHPMSPAAVQPGPHPMGPTGVDPNMLMPSAIPPSAPPQPELDPIARFLLTRHHAAV